MRGETRLVHAHRTLTLVASLLLLPAGLVALTPQAQASHGNAIILVLDNDEDLTNANNARTSLVNAGYQECAAVAANQHVWNCFELVKPSEYCSKLTQNGRRVLYVGENPSNAAYGALYLCRNTLNAWTAGGGCLVAQLENNGGNVWDWTPRSVFNQYPLWTNTAGDDVTKTAAGNAHVATAGVTLNGWSVSYHQYFRNVAPFMTVLAYRGGTTANPVVLTWGNGYGGVLISGFDADQHNNLGNANARQFVRQSVQWALECSCDRPVVFTARDELTEQLPLVAELLQPVDDLLAAVGLEPSMPAADVTVELAGVGYVTSDGAVYLESNNVPGLQRFGEDGDTRLV